VTFERFGQLVLGSTHVRPTLLPTSTQQLDLQRLLISPF